MQRSQQELRNLRGQELKDHYAENIQAVLDQQLQTADRQRRTARQQQNQADEQYWSEIKKRLENAVLYLEQQCRQDYPFAHPVYWGGFVVQGMS